jgi:hypothetical protein
MLGFDLLPDALQDLVHMLLWILPVSVSIQEKKLVLRNRHRLMRAKHGLKVLKTYDFPILRPTGRKRDTLLRR